MRKKPEPELSLGTVIDGRYEINALLGQGGMGDVYRARHIGLDTQVALKVLQRSLAGNDEQARRFTREANACSRLKHPNTIRVTDFGRASSGHLYLVMELLEGRTLSQVLRQEAPLDPLRVARIALQITKSVSEAHEVGLIHRDLKPANLFLCDIHGESDFVKVLDFGIAKFVQADSEGGTTLTRNDLIVGTPLYLSPEQATLRPVTPRSDLYSLGVIMYHMVSGAPPFRGDTPVALLLKHMEERPPPLDADRPGLEVPEPIATLIFELLEKDPERRPESARAVGLRLQRFISGSARPPRLSSTRARDAREGEPDELVLDDEDDDELDLTGLGIDDPKEAPSTGRDEPPSSWKVVPISAASPAVGAPLAATPRAATPPPPLAATPAPPLAAAPRAATPSPPLAAAPRAQAPPPLAATSSPPLAAAPLAATPAPPLAAAPRAATPSPPLAAAPLAAAPLAATSSPPLAAASFAATPGPPPAVARPATEPAASLVPAAPLDGGALVAARGPSSSRVTLPMPLWLPALVAVGIGVLTALVLFLLRG